jgi:hypothetical protein
MDPAYRESLVVKLRGISEEMRKQPGFFSNERLKAMFVCVLTLQGAAQFHDEVKLSLVLADFCQDQADIITQSN